MADVGSLLKCADCGVLFFSRQAFLQHECHKALNSIKTEGHVTENDHIRTMFQCEKCKGWFWDEEIYAKHACQQLHESSQSNEGDASAAESSTSSSSCGPTSTAGQEKGNWTKAQTKLLISLYKENEEKVSNGLMTKKCLWQKISNSFREKTYNYTPDQVSGRWKTITRAYKSIKDHNKKSGNSKKNYEYEEDLDDLMGDCPTISPVTISSQKRKQPEASSQDEDDDEIVDQDQDSSSSEASIPKEASRKKVKKSKSSEVMDLLKLHTQQQQEFRKEEAARKDKMHKEKMALLSTLVQSLQQKK
ncbi:uncharacterized protein LOC132565115 [Ylistrum balloti]|uniref:uncharacterized protein LOC132565115 n=1 Tax=Ylistrum balloti TaxID=509963 RepID=UPI00290581CF|nr:uncharacterized protein LOC132565115 [Ylistrum balloti]